MNRLSSVAFMLRRRRSLQALWLSVPIINLVLAVTSKAQRSLIVSALSVALLAMALMVRVWLWPVAVAAVLGLAVTSYSAERGEIGMFFLGVFDVTIAAVCYWICARWKQAYPYARHLFVGLGRYEAAEWFHGLRGRPSYQLYLQSIGVPRSVVVCVEELCEERLTIQELVDLRSRLERRNDDSSS